MADGDANGINNLRNYTWQGELPYRLVFTMRATRIENLVALEGAAQGDLEGSGRWHFSRKGAVNIVRYECHEYSTPVWMTWSRHNHKLVIAQGGEKLARMLGAPLLSQENIDLMAELDPSGMVHAPAAENRH